MTVEGTKTVVAVTDQECVGRWVLSDGKGLFHDRFAPSGMAYNAATPIVDGDTLIYAGSGARDSPRSKTPKQGDAFTPRNFGARLTVSPQFNTAVFMDGFLYGLTAAERLVLYQRKDRSGRLVRIRANRGKPQGYGSVVDAGSVLLALTPASQLYVVQPTEKAFTQLASIKVADKPSYAYPIVSGNRIFIRDRDSVALLTVE